ncbi:MAG TPA: hypothetical protein VF533_12650 [Solirubrobacteraceae bacterium]
MDRTLLFWTLGLFFGTSIAFRAIQRATADQSLAVTLAAEVALLAAVIGAIVFFARRRKGGD